MTSHTTHRRAAAGRRGRIGAFAAVLATSLLALVGTASAHQLEIYKFQKFFTGSDATGGAFSSSIAGVAVNNSNGRVYVLDIAPGSNLRISQFNANGEAQLFSGLEGVSSFTAREGVSSPEGADLVFDNTGHNEGLWVRGGLSGPTSIKAFREDGTKRVEGGPNFNLCGLGVNPVNGFLWAGSGQTATRLDPNTAFGGETYFYEQGPCHFTIDPAGNFYVNRISGTYTPGLFKYADESQFLKESFNPAKLILQFTKLNTKYTAFDTGDNTLFAVEGNPGNQVTQYSDAGQPIQTFGLAEGPFTGLAGARAVAVNPATQDVYVTSTDGSPRVDIFHRSETVTVPDATTNPAGHPNGTSAVLKGTINPDGVKTTQCKFEWGQSSFPGEYSNGTIPCSEGNEFEGSTNQSVTAEVSSLTLGSSFHYRVAVKNANGRFTFGADRVFEASTAPTTGNIIVDKVNTDGARFNAEITPHGGTTHYHFEVGTEDCSSHECTHIPVADATLPSRLTPAAVSQSAIGLSSGSGYYVRLVVENGAGQVSVSHFFNTYPAPPAFDPCANANVRKQTGASLLPDCRAYELVSAANAGGYEVESDLVPGETPFSSYPDAKERVLYGLHFGSIPGIAGSPTNDGLDPYVAERTNTGWVTKYVGIPADGMADPKAFGSPLLGADEGLNSFAFGGKGICVPCFTGGGGTNIPLRLNGGAPTQGMLGTLSPSEPAPSGHVAKYLSADGSHLVFGSKQKFEEAGVEGALTIYQRDLEAGTTQVVSTDQTGATLSGAVAELDQSSDGSRVVTGKVVSTDAAGNDHYHLYMHIGNSTESADLTPGVASSALFDGMTSDGSKVFLTTSDQLLPGEDTDSNADIYEAEVDPFGAVQLKLISTKNGAPSNDETCAPPGIPNSWNSVSGNGKCNAVAYANGAGLASGDGTFYFVSPEQLDGGEGEPGQVNLYVVKPGHDPLFVATVDSSVVKAPQGPAEHPLENATFATAEQAEALAVDNSNGDVYVVQGTKSKISRFDSTGAAKEFTAGPGIGTNSITGFTFSTPSGGQVAVDNAGLSPFKGDFYVTNGTSVKVFGPTGVEEGSLNGSGTFKGSLVQACGVAVDQTNGTVYVADKSAKNIWKYVPTGTAPITDADYTVTGIATTGMSPCALAADGNGHVYASEFSEGPAKQFAAASFLGGSPPAQSGSTIAASSKALSTDPVTHELFVDELNQIGVYNEAGEKRSTISGFNGSRGVAENPNNGHVFVSQVAAGKILEFGYKPVPYNPIDNPGVVHGVKQAGVYSPADFQVTRDGRYAAFDSVIPVTGFENEKHSEIYRYDSEEGIEEVECASCATNGAAAKANTFLSPYGINMTEGGKVFYTTSEGLVLADTNEKRDAYEWSGGANIGNISTGRSISDSTLLSVSRDGKDAYFFTRDVLVPSDENGGAVKIYDAREKGGYLTFPSPKPCAASDECHGADTEPPPPPDINSVNGTGEEQRLPKTTTCRRGFVKRHGSCVRKHRRKHKRASHRSGGNG